MMLTLTCVFIAFSSEVGTGSREENASKYKNYPPPKPNARANEPKPPRLTPPDVSDELVDDPRPETSP